MGCAFGEFDDDGFPGIMLFANEIVARGEGDHGLTAMERGFEGWMELVTAGSRGIGGAVALLPVNSDYREDGGLLGHSILRLDRARASRRRERRG